MPEPDYKPGDAVVITDAYGREHLATALTGIEGTHRDGRKVHDFPVVWVRTGRSERIPWPVESISRPDRSADGQSDHEIQTASSGVPISDKDLTDLRGWVADPEVCEIDFEVDEWRALLTRLDGAEERVRVLEEALRKARVGLVVWGEDEGNDLDVVFADIAAALYPATNSGDLHLLDNVRVVLWFCPVDHRHCVEWSTDERGMTPHCIEPVCGQVGDTRSTTPP